VFPQPFVPTFFLFEHAFAMLSKLCHPLEGGIVFEVAFGGVRDGVGTNRIECARASPSLIVVTEGEVRLMRRKAPIWPE
jgi:hypothetical protein